MAAFGLPGGWELGIIATVILLLFVPGILMFGVGFLLGKKSGERTVNADVDTPAVSADQSGEAFTETQADGPRDA